MVCQIPLSVTYNYSKDVVFVACLPPTSCIYVTEDASPQLRSEYPPGPRIFPFPLDLFEASSGHMRRTLLLLEFQVTAVSGLSRLSARTS